MSSGKMYIVACILLVLISPNIILLVSGEVNLTKLIEEYPELGETTIKFPNGQIGYLTMPSPSDVPAVNLAVSKIEDNVNFTLYTRDKPEGYGLKNYTDVPENFDKSKKTVFITHGWMSSGSAEVCISIKNAFLNVSDINVFIIDWSSIAGDIFYFYVKDRLKDVGAYYSIFLNFLIQDLNMNPKSFHLIGHSLGAHVSGFAARGIKKGTTGRVTGLDPALPGFGGDDQEAIEGRLNKNDSNFVDIIHTCAGFLGFYDPIGHADFYPNGGTPPQPGCSILGILEACSHGRSYELFAESIIIEENFEASKCETKKQLEDEVCNDKKTEPMGEPTPRNARGKFYLETTGEKPFIKSS